MENILEKATDAVSFIKERIGDRTPEIAIILGSGMGKVADAIIDGIEIRYSDIPNFPISSVVGHSNKLIIGFISGKCVAVMDGRFHYYEGYDMSQVAFPIKVFAKLGIQKLIASNAAGGINEEFKIGDLMIITDHINLSGNSPLRGKNEDELGTRFPSMTNAYTPRLVSLVKDIVANSSILNHSNLREGVYAFMPGPQYETKAEIRMLSILGASAVGMSTVPEVISAAHSGMEVLGLSCITNLCFSTTPPNHQEVLETAKKVEDEFKNLVVEIIAKM